MSRIVPVAECVLVAALALAARSPVASVAVSRGREVGSGQHPPAAQPVARPIAGQAPRSTTRLIGATMPGDPAVLYADPNMFAFSAGFATDLRATVSFVDETRGVREQAEQSTDRRPRSQRGVSCVDPTINENAAFGLTPSAATTTFYFGPDSTNAHVRGAYALWRQVNDAAAKPLVRNVLPDTVAFLAYRYAVDAGVSGDSLAYVPIGLLPISSTDTTAGIITSGSLRAVEMHFLMTNGLPGASERLRRVSLVVTLPRPARGDQPSCGAAPLYTGMSIVAAPAAPRRG